MGSLLSVLLLVPSGYAAALGTAAQSSPIFNTTGCQNGSSFTVSVAGGLSPSSFTTAITPSVVIQHDTEADQNVEVVYFDNPSNTTQDAAATSGIPYASNDPGTDGSLGVAIRVKSLIAAFYVVAFVVELNVEGADLVQLARHRRVAITAGEHRQARLLLHAMVFKLLKAAGTAIFLYFNYANTLKGEPTSTSVPLRPPAQDGHASFAASQTLHKTPSLTTIISSHPPVVSTPAETTRLYGIV